MAATRVVMHQIVLPSEVDSLGICFGGQVPSCCTPAAHRCHPQALSVVLSIPTVSVAYFPWCKAEL